MNKTHLDLLENISKQNHIYMHSDGIGYFNPSTLVMYSPKNLDPLISSLIFQHEFTHVKLSSSVYGKIVFFLRFIALDLVSFCFSREIKIDNYWKIYLEITKIEKRFLSKWIEVQEGMAMYTEYRQIQKIDNNALDDYLGKFTTFLEKESPYKNGFKKIKLLSQMLPEIVFRNVIQQIGNINYINHINDFFEKENYPDDLLDILINKISKHTNSKTVLFQYEKELFLEGGESYTIADYSKSFLKKMLNVDFFDEEENSVFLTLIDFFNKNFFIVEYQERLVELKENYEQKVNDVIKSSSLNQILTYNITSSKFVYPFWIFNFSNRNLASIEKESLMNIINLNEIINRFLPTNKEKFDKFFKELMTSPSDLSTLLINIFPPIENFRLKNNSGFFSTNLFKSLFYKKKISKFSVMNQIIFTCSKEDANRLEADMKKSIPEESGIIMSTTNGEGFGHWQESLTVAVTILASSIQIIDTFLNWTKESDQNTTILIGEIKFESKKDQKKLLKELEKIKKEINKLKGKSKLKLPK